MEKDIIKIDIDKIVIPENENISLFSSHFNNLITLTSTDEYINNYIKSRQKLI